MRNYLCVARNFSAREAKEIPCVDLSRRADAASNNAEKEAPLCRQSVPDSPPVPDD